MAEDDQRKIVGASGILCLTCEIERRQIFECPVFNRKITGYPVGEASVRSNVLALVAN